MNPDDTFDPEADLDPEAEAPRPSPPRGRINSRRGGRVAPPPEPPPEAADGADGLDDEFADQPNAPVDDIEDLEPPPSLGGRTAPADVLNMGDTPAMPMGRASSPKLWASASNWPTCTHYRVWKMENGVPAALGVIERDASEEDFIRTFLSAMPKPGEGRAQFRCRPLDGSGNELGAEFPFNVSDGHAYLARLRSATTPQTYTQSMGVPPELLAMLQVPAQLAERRAQQLEQTLAEERKEQERQRNEIASERIHLAAEQARGVQSITERLLADEGARREAQIRAEMERDRAVREQLAGSSQTTLQMVTTMLGGAQANQGQLFQQQMALMQASEVARREQEQRAMESERLRLAAAAEREAEERRREREETEARRRAELADLEERRRRDREEAEAKRHQEMADAEDRRRRDREEAEAKRLLEQQEYESKRAREQAELSHRLEMARMEMAARAQEAEARAQAAMREADARLQREREELQLRHTREIEEARLRRQAEEQAYRERVDRERAEIEARERRERDERERRDRLDAEEKLRRERHDLEMTAAREKDRDRQHARQMEEMKISAAQSREHAERMLALQNAQLAARTPAAPDMLSQALTTMNLLGLDPKETAQKLLGGGGGWMEAMPKLAAGAAEFFRYLSQAGAAQQPSVQQRFVPPPGLPMPPPAAFSPPPQPQPEHAPAESPAASPAAAPTPAAKPAPAAPQAAPTAPPAAPTPAGAEMPLARKRAARVAIRKLVDTARKVPEATWEAEVLGAVMLEPALVEYLQRVPLQDALTEGGAEAALVERVMAMARQSPTFGPLLAQSVPAAAPTPAAPSAAPPAKPEADSPSEGAALAPAPEPTP